MAICGTCQAKLAGPEPPPLCAFNEVCPLVPPAGVLVEARLRPAVEYPRNAGSWRASSSGRWGGCSGPGRRSPGNRVKRGGLGTDRQEFREVGPRRM